MNLPLSFPYLNTLFPESSASATSVDGGASSINVAAEPFSGVTRAGQVRLAGIIGNMAHIFDELICTRCRTCVLQRKICKSLCHGFSKKSTDK